MVFIHYSQKYREILPCPRLCLLVETHKAQAIEVPLKEKMIENLYCLENNNDDLYQSYFFRDKFVCQHRFQYICIHPKSILKYYYGLNCVPLKFMS